MICAGSLILGIQYLSEKSMQSIIDVATDDSNHEYDWSLPFVTAQDDTWPPKYDIDTTYYKDKDGKILPLLAN
jgi:hypothetical protein